LARSWMGTFALFGTRSLTMAQHRATLAHVTSEIKCCRYIRIYGGERRQTERERDRERFLYTLYMYVYILYHSCVCSIPACAVRCLHFFTSACPTLCQKAQDRAFTTLSSGKKWAMALRVHGMCSMWSCLLHRNLGFVYFHDVFET
jgi:hypothetical protein